MPHAPYHRPVLRDEVVRALSAVRGGTFIDGTCGGGGHARALLLASEQVRVLCLDRDPEAVAETARALAEFGGRATVVRGRFSELGALAASHGFAPCAGVLLDLGVSSRQIDAPGRGFSFDRDGPLDMRMDPKGGPGAAELLATVGEEGLADLLRTFGEVRGARRIARRILAAPPPATTGELGRRVDEAAPRAGGPKGLKPRVFQALRIAVNDELGELARLLASLPDPLAQGGRIAVISYHSLEDRAVKRAFDDLAGLCVCPPGLPVCACGRTPILRPAPRGALVATDAERAGNPRARSARLRVGERVAAHPSEEASPPTKERR